MPLVCGRVGGIKRCSMPKSAQRWSNPCAPVAARLAELTEHEQRVIAHAAEMTVPSRALLCAMGRADRTVHDQRDPLGRLAFVNLVDPPPRQVRQRSTIVGRCQHFGLETSHLACGPGLGIHSPPADYCRITGSRARRSASFTSSYPANRPKTDWRNRPTRECRRLRPVRVSLRTPQAMSCRPSTSSSSRNKSNPPSELILEYGIPAAHGGQNRAVPHRFCLHPPGDP